MGVHTIKAYANDSTREFNGTQSDLLLSNNAEVELRFTPKSFSVPVTAAEASMSDEMTLSQGEWLER